MIYIFNFVEIFSTYNFVLCCNVGSCHIRQNVIIIVSGIYTFHGSYFNPFDIIGQIARQIRVPYLTCIFEYRSYYRYIYI